MKTKEDAAEGAAITEVRVFDPKDQQQKREAPDVAIRRFRLLPSPR